MESDEVYTMEVGGCLLVRMNDDGDGRDCNEEDDCTGVTSVWQELFWPATCRTSFHPHSNLAKSKQYCYPHFMDERTVTCPKAHN